MKKIFEPVRLGTLELKNRILRSAALTDKDGEDGRFLPYEEQVCAALAQNDVAAVITGMIGVGTNSCAADFMVKAYDPHFVEDFGRVCAASHDNGGKIIAQISHAGAQAMVLEEGEYAWAPSDTVNMMGLEAKEMSKEQIAAVVSDFGKAAAACKAAGADAVQLHCAHAYLLSQFLSPYCNRRTDEYGGSVENRARIIFEAYDAVRKAVGDLPVMVKINYEDLVGAEGLQGEDCVWVCRQLDKRGVDAIEVSSGIAATKESRPMQKAVEGAMEGHFTKGALKVAENVDCAVISVGGYRTPEQILHCLNLGGIDAISMCRPFSNPAYMSGWDRSL